VARENWKRAAPHGSISHKHTIKHTIKQTKNHATTNSMNNTSVIAHQTNKTIRAVSARSHWTRRGVIGLLLAVALGWLALPAQAAPTLTCSYVASKSQGTIAYTALRAFHGGSEGRFVINRKTFPGSAYAATGGGLGLVWYYGYTGRMAGNALLTLQPDGTYSGPIWFFDRAGNQIDAGTIILH
jgi:hypothetical protein